MMIAAAELRKRSQDHSREFKVTARRLADFVASVEAEESLLIQRLQDAAARRIRRVDGSPSDEPEQASTSQAGTSQSKLDATAIQLPVTEPCSVPQPELYEEY
jgi:putative transposase